MTTIPTNDWLATVTLTTFNERTGEPFSYSVRCKTRDAAREWMRSFRAQYRVAQGRVEKVPAL